MGRDPPGFTVESIYVSPDGRVFTLAEADSVGPLAEAVAQFSAAIDWEVVPVAAADEMVPHLESGFEWART